MLVYLPTVLPILAAYAIWLVIIWIVVGGAD